MVVGDLSATVKERLRQSLKRECVRLCEIEKEMAPLYTPYNRFLDLDTERDTRFAGAVRILSSFGEAEFLTLVSNPDFDMIQTAFRGTFHYGQPLWESIRAVLGEMGEMREVDLVSAVGSLGLTSSTTAVHSAINGHRAVFSTRRLGRKKFVALKKEK
jgi:hypothetical protein